MRLSGRAWRRQLFCRRRNARTASKAKAGCVFRYAPGDNPNGSARNIAGILNEKRNVLGLMPHPERVVDPLLGGTDGRALFESLIEALRMTAITPRSSASMASPTMPNTRAFRS